MRMGHWLAGGPQTWSYWYILYTKGRHEEYSASGVHSSWRESFSTPSYNA